MLIQSATDDGQLTNDQYKKAVGRETPQLFHPNQ